MVVVGGGGSRAGGIIVSTGQGTAGEGSIAEQNPTRSERRIELLYSWEEQLIYIYQELHRTADTRSRINSSSGV